MRSRGRSLTMYIYCLLLFLPFSSVVGVASNWDIFIGGITSIFSSGFTQQNNALLEDAHLNITQLINKYGYPTEEHTVKTEDGYILNFHRIPQGKNGARNGLVVFLMHGIMDSSDSWILQGPELALGYILADEGFDVWMGNARGNKHGLKHSSLNASQSEFWEFTWEEIGLYDLPAMIDHSLNTSGKENLYYIGHSQGTTSFYVMTSMRPDYNNKISLMFSLAPEAWMGHVKSPIVKLFSPAYEILGYLLGNFNTFIPSTEFFNRISAIVCSLSSIKCDNIFYATIGDNNKVNGAFLPIIFGHMPTGSSTLQFVHYGQLVQSGKFRRYDYGSEKNLILYGTSTPPDYTIVNVTVPIVLYYSGNDWFSDAKDVEILKDNLPNVHGIVYMEDFNHIDYVYASEAKDVIYKKIISQIYDFENEFRLLNMINVLHTEIVGDENTDKATN